MKRAFFVLFVLLLAIPFSAFAQDDTTDALASYRSEDGAFVAILPEGWFAEGSREDGLLIGNSEDTLAMMMDDEQEGPVSGQVGISVTPFASAEMLAMLELGEDATEVELLDGFLALLTSAEDDTSDLAEVEETEFDTRPAATTSGAIDEATEAKIYLHHIAQDTLALSIIAAPIGELEAALAEAEGALLGVGYSLELTETYVAEDESIAFMHPFETTVDNSTGVAIILSDPTALEDLMEPGQYGIIVINLSGMGMASGDLDADTQTIAETVLAEGDELTEVLTILINDEDEVKVIGISNEEGNEGGVFVMEKEMGVYAVIYYASNGNSDTISATALSVLYSADNLPEDEASEEE